MCVQYSKWYIEREMQFCKKRFYIGSMGWTVIAVLGAESELPQI